jgi:hypothetical protein
MDGGSVYSAELRQLIDECAVELAALFEHVTLAEEGRAALLVARWALAEATFSLATSAAAAAAAAPGA